ncbi:CBR-HUM-5 protein [Dirofilaria immitis]|nr:CBR-HUM-5 protein [Dirofilaria immitis]
MWKKDAIWDVMCNGQLRQMDDEIKLPSQRYDYLLELENIRRNSNFSKILFSSYIQLIGLSVSKESDNTVIFHLGNNDFIGCLYNHKNEDRVGEVIGILCAHFERKFNKKLKVTVGELQCRLGSKGCSIHINHSDKITDGHAMFRKHGSTQIELTCPMPAISA